MANIIPKHIYKTIERRLHTYEDMKNDIAEWQASIQSHNNTPELSRGQGFYSDPTSMTVIKLLNPPKNIREIMCWVNLIDNARCYFVDCGESKEMLFDVWYGKEKQSVISAATKIPCDKVTFHRWRNDLVYWISLRATQHMLIKFE